MNRNRMAICVVGLACPLVMAASVYAADIQVGTWKINLAKSKYGTSSRLSCRVLLAGAKPGARGMSDLGSCQASL